MRAEVMTSREAAALADHVEARAYAGLFAAAPDALRARLGLRVERLAGATALIAPGLPTTMFNRVIGLGLDDAATPGSVAQLRTLFRDAGVKAWWLHWNPDAQPVDMPALLAAQGFTLPARRAWAKMLRETAQPPAVRSDLAVAEARPADVAATASCIAQAFAMPPFMADWLAALHGRPAWRLYAVADAGVVVGGACLFVDGDAGWLGMGAVLASHRRRGGQGAAMARRIADAGAAGCRWVVTETGEPVDDEPNPSLANMRRHGFRQVASRLNFECNDAR
jgi:hypothetical protein